MKQMCLKTTASNHFRKYFSFLVRVIFVVVAVLILSRYLMIFDRPAMESMKKSHNIDNESTLMKPAKAKGKTYVAVKEFRHRVQMSHKKLNNEMKSIRRENSDQLPKGSYFDDDNRSQLRGGTLTVKGFGSEQDSLKVLPDNKLVACLVTKNMSTIMRAILCYLNDPVHFRDSGRSLHMALFFGEKICKDESAYTLQNTSDAHIRKRLGYESFSEMLVEWKPFVIARDPIDRFLSAYVDKCIRGTLQNPPCNGCRHNMTCFIIREYERMRQVNREQKWNWSPEDTHFFPQNWRCAFRDHLGKYEVLQYDGHIVTVIDALRRRDVLTADIEFIRRSLSGRQHRTAHSTMDSKARLFFERRLRGSSFLLELVVEMFYWDFQLFDFPLPVI